MVFVCMIGRRGGFLLLHCCCLHSKFSVVWKNYVVEGRRERDVESLHHSMSTIPQMFYHVRIPNSIVSITIEFQASRSPIP